MRYSLFSVSDYYPDWQPDPNAFIMEQVELAQMADQMGYYAYFNAEHHFHEYGLIPDPAILFGAAAMKTERVLLGPAVAVRIAFAGHTALMNYRKPSNCDILVTGEDLGAKHRVMALLREMGLNSYDVGAGEVCRTVEGLTSMLIYLNYAYHLRQPGVKIAQIDPGLDFIPDDSLLPLK